MTPQTAQSISACDPVNAARSTELSHAIARATQQVFDDTAKQSFHPLEVMPFFRRWPRSFLRNLVYTLMFNAMFALLFTFLGYFGALMSGKAIDLTRVVSQFGWNLLISNVIGFLFWGVLSNIEPLLRVINRYGTFAVIMFYTLLGTAIVTLAFFILSFLPGFAVIGSWLFSPRQMMTSLVISFVISSVIGLLWRRRVAELAAEIALADERTRAEAAERAATQANLRALQAQIEPHFLFNTLANVTSLIHTRPDDAKKMLEQFITYLRATLAQTREVETTLAQEFMLMEKFLAILQVRMGARLRFALTLPDALKSFAIPPMLIQPLVENGIKHGLEPKVDGGELTLSAERVADTVRIIVADTGLGFQRVTSNGIGLKNVRERLQSLYGDRGQISIEDNTPSGTRVVITVPA